MKKFFLIPIICLVFSFNAYSQSFCPPGYQFFGISVPYTGTIPQGLDCNSLANVTYCLRCTPTGEWDLIINDFLVSGDCVPKEDFHSVLLIAIFNEIAHNIPGCGIGPCNGGQWQQDIKVTFNICYRIVHEVGWGNTIKYEECTGNVSKCITVYKVCIDENGKVVWIPGTPTIEGTPDCQIGYLNLPPSGHTWEDSWITICHQPFTCQ